MIIDLYTNNQYIAYNLFVWVLKVTGYFLFKSIYTRITKSYWYSNVILRRALKCYIKCLSCAYHFTIVHNPIGKILCTSGF